MLNIPMKYKNICQNLCHFNEFKYFKHMHTVIKYFVEIDQRPQQIYERNEI